MKRIIGLGMLSLLAGCNATETGNPYGDPPDNGGEGVDGGSNCEETSEDVETTEQTELGFSADDLAAAIAGQHTAALQWLDNQVAGYGPESGTTEITVGVSTGAARFVTSRPRATDGLQTEIGLIGPGCRNELELDVTLTLTSSGGALDETIDTVVRAANADFARARFVLETDALSGALEVSVTTPPNSQPDGSPELHFDVGLSDLGMSGSVNLLATYRSTDGTAVGQGGGGLLAQWPVDSCGPDALRLPIAERVRGVAITALTDAYTALSPAAFEYDAGEAAEGTFSLEATEDSMCHGLDGGADEARGVEYAGVVNLVTDDGRVDGRFPVKVTASVAADGTLIELYVSRNEFTDDPARMAELPGAFGIQDPVDLEGYDMGAVDYNSQLASNSAWGRLSIRGFQQAPCVTDPPEPEEIPGQGGGSPGCRGSDIFELWRASFGVPPDDGL
ncbi:MAG TPA: hypothetical protein VF989_03280 [Polyangiaceae bacterium]